MQIKATSAADYLKQIPADRRPHVERLRKLIKSSVPSAEEELQWGMLGYSIEGRPFAAIASHKSYLSLYLMDLYTQPGLREKHEVALAPLRLGKSCINFRDVEELPLDTVSAILEVAPRVQVTSGTLATKKAVPKRKRSAKKGK
jgi:uncharacterized protein YdhG (YjbR/CyaY superfamily)